MSFKDHSKCEPANTIEVVYIDCQNTLILVTIKNHTIKNIKSRGAQRMKENEIGTIVVESAIDVHRELGPGLLESVYVATQRP